MVMELVENGKVTQGHFVTLFLLFLLFKQTGGIGFLELLVLCLMLFFILLVSVLKNVGHIAQKETVCLHGKFLAKSTSLFYSCLGRL